MRDGPRNRVNVNIDHNLKIMFEDLKEIHKKEWTEVLEDAVRELLIKTDPVKMLEYNIKLNEEKQEERRQALIRTKENIHVLGHTPKVDAELETKREELFLKESSWLSKQIIRGEVNWNRVFFYYQFETKKEALTWFRPRIERMKELEKK